MVRSLLVGLVVGFVLAIPPGPITIACLRQALAGQTRDGVALALAASAMDIVYALLAAFASSALFAALRDMVTGNAWYLLAFQGGVSWCWSCLAFITDGRHRQRLPDLPGRRSGSARSATHPPI
jgi:threonine/homoserine/homoserine lactone efflux protein